MKTIAANLLDWPKPSLSPEIWEPSQNLKSEVKNFILDFIHSFAQANNLKALDKWVMDIQFVGGLTTNTFNPASDADIHLAVDLKKFVELEIPEMSEKEAGDYLDEIRKQVDQVKAKIPNTQHPVEIYFNTEFTPPVSTEWSGIYSILNDAWLEYPHIVDQTFDIEKLHPELLEFAKETASELDASFGEIKRDVADIKDLQETINEWPEQQRGIFEKKLQKRLDNLETEIKELVNVREDVAEKRKHYKALSEQEVRFKYLQKYFYMHVLTDLKTLLKQSPELEMKDIPVVENIMQQANLNKKAYDYSSYWVDPNGEIYNANESHFEWIANNLELLYNNYGIRFSQAETPESIHNLDQDSIHDYTEDLIRDNTLLKQDWTRVFVGDEIAIEIKDLNNPPPSMEKPFIEFASETKGEIIVGDLNHKTVSIDDKEGFAKGIQKGLQKERMSQTASQESEEKILAIDFDDTVAHENSDHSIGTPMEGVKEALTHLRNDGYKLEIYSHRADTEEGADEIKEYLDKNDIPYDSIFHGDKPLATYYIDDRGLMFTNWSDIVKKVQEGVGKEATLNLPTIDPTTLNRTEPYALFIGTQMFSKKDGIDLFDVYGQHPMITEHNARPTVTLDTLIKENIPVIGKAPRAGDKQPIQDLSRVMKTAAKMDSTWISPSGEVIPVDMGDHASWVADHLDWLSSKYGSDFVRQYYEEAESEEGDTEQALFDIVLNLIAEGWVRVFQSDNNLIFQIDSFAHPPTNIEDFFLQAAHNSKDIVVEDLGGVHVSIAEPELGFIKGLKKGMQQKRMQTVAQLGSPYDYSSTQFNLPKELSEKIIRWAVENIPEEDIVQDEIDPETKGIQLNSHISLKYGLLTDNFNDVEKALKGEKGPHIKFGKTYFFSSDDKDYDVVLITVESEDLHKLNEKLCSQVKHDDPSGPEYKPHVTVAYIKKGLGQKYEGKDIITGEELDLNTLMFSPKKGEKRELELAKTTEKESSFMPSNTDLAPSNDWIGEVGYPGNKEMDAPQNVSDEETWYSPENDRPRSKNFLKRMLSLFQKPLSKKEPKEIVPVKEADIKTKADAGDYEAFWIDPSGETHQLEDPAQEHYDADIVRHLESPIADGWTKVRLAENELSIGTSNLNQIPAILDDYLANHKVQEIYIENMSGTWVKLSYEDAMQNGLQKAVNKALQQKRLTTAKQWITPTEHVNQPGMDWGWADYIYNYIDENWQDLLVGWLELDPKNYVKPVVLIERIYEDEGAVSAWVYIEFVNVAGQSDAYMKLVVTGDVHYEPSYEPEGVDTIESLENIEIEVLDYGKSDDLEKSSSYGPTNYKGPSVADHGYQNSAWDDMNVTYSPEEDEKFLDQNGADGYPNRWMGRHRGPYYTNEGKVVKMLEDTKPQKQAEYRGNMDAWLAPDGQEFSIHRSHKNWIVDEINLLHEDYDLMIPLEGTPEGNDLVSWLISKGWVRVTGILPNEIDLTVLDINKLPSQVEQFVWKYKPEVVIVEDLKGEDSSFDKEEYSKGLIQHATLKIKADIGGQTINEILHLIQTNGGATYSLSKGNLVGTDGYAVAIYPQQEQITDLVDYEVLEDYITKNESLLNNPNNSLGAWISNGKTYLDIINVVKDKEEAKKIARQYNQLAIFDLRNLVEIPVQKVAKLAGVYSDKEQQAIYDKQFSDRWRDSSDKINGGNEYYDYSQLNGNDYPSAKDLDKERGLLDQLENPADRNMPTGLGEYSITYYDAFPAEGDTGGI